MEEVSTPGESRRGPSPSSTGGSGTRGLDIQATEGLGDTISRVDPYRVCEILRTDDSLIVFDIRPVDEVLDKHLCLLPGQCVIRDEILRKDFCHRVLIQIEPECLDSEGFAQLKVDGGVFLLTEEKDRLGDILKRWDEFDNVLFIGPGSNPRSEASRVGLCFALLDSMSPQKSLSSRVMYLDDGFDALCLCISNTELALGNYIESGNPRSLTELIPIRREFFKNSRMPIPNPGLSASPLALPPHNMIPFKSASGPSLSTTNGRNGFSALPPGASHLRSNPVVSRMPGISGIKSLGGTCYMSCIIQCLNATRPLSDFFRFRYLQHRPSIDPEKVPIKPPYISDSLYEIICHIWSDNPAPVNPISLARAIMARNVSYIPSIQQDAQEFLMFLLNVLDEELKLLHPLQPADETPTNGPSSMINNFRGLLKSEIGCLLCGNVSINENSFITLSLPLSTVKLFKIRSEKKLPKYLDSFFEKELLKKKSHARECHRCKRVGDFTKKLSLTKLPKIMILHLKRFHIHRGTSSRINSRVIVPTR